MFVCLSLARQPPVSQGLFIHEVSRSHTMMHHRRLDSSGWVTSLSQRPLPTQKCTTSIFNTDVMPTIHLTTWHHISENHIFWYCIFWQLNQEQWICKYGWMITLHFLYCFSTGFANKLLYAPDVSTFCTMSSTIYTPVFHVTISGNPCMSQSSPLCKFLKL